MRRILLVKGQKERKKEMIDSDISHKVVYVLLSELDKPFGICSMSKEMSISMDITEGLNKYGYSYNMLGIFDDSDDIKNTWKERWEAIKGNFNFITPILQSEMEEIAELVKGVKID